jgi:hypothetical protein
VVGVEKVFARDAAEIAAADGTSSLPWTLPLHRLEAVALVGIVRTAAITTLATVSGMRASELMELRIGCRCPPEEPVPGLTRFRIASKVVKGQPLGGTDDEWVVVEPVYRAVELAEQLHDSPQDGALLFGRFAFDVRYRWFRNWVNSRAGQRLGLAPIPDGPVNLRMLRRTLALEMAYRPGGVLASKIHLKHIAVATTEGYASRPGGAQAELLAEVNKHESDRNLDLVLAEFRNYQQGILPAGPGAHSLTEFFAHIDAKLDATAVKAPKTQRSDRDVLNLLTKRAKVLHLGPANYCWFTDPSRALCLKLAGTPTADRPLVGMCDSARCPQATHHPATGPSGPSTPNAPRSPSASSAPRARPNAPGSKPTTTEPSASSPRSTPPAHGRGVRMRISAAQRTENENRIRAATDRRLRGEIPPGGKSDIKTLARDAAVDRTAFYGTRPYAPLRVEFERRLQALQQAGEIPDPREAQITRLKAENAKLSERLAAWEQVIDELTDFRIQALARLAAQHEEIIRLRESAVGTTRVSRLPAPRTTVIGTCG